MVSKSRKSNVDFEMPPGDTPSGLSKVAATGPQDTSPETPVIWLQWPTALLLLSVCPLSAQMTHRTLEGAQTPRAHWEG